MDADREPAGFLHPTEPAPALPTAGDLFRFDESRGAYFLADARFSRLRWSPSGERLLVLIPYETFHLHGVGLFRTIQGLDFLTYTVRDEPNALAALLVHPLDSSVVPFVFPFRLQRVPRDIAWWDDESLLLVGRVVDGVLENQPTGGAEHLTRVRLSDGAVESVGIPENQLLLHGGAADYGAGLTVWPETGQIILSYRLSEVIGGGRGLFGWRPGEEKGEEVSEDLATAAFPQRVEGCADCAVSPDGRLARMQRVSGTSRQRWLVIEEESAAEEGQ